jgi:hypothetical protein
MKMSMDQWYHDTNQLAPWSRVLLKKLTAFYGNQRFITAFTSARQPSLS